MSHALQVDLQVACEGDHGIPSLDDIERFLNCAMVMAANGGMHAEVGLRIVDEAEGLALNRDYRGRDYATNVLSFPAGDLPALPDDEPLPLGDLVLCAPVVSREAAEQGKALPHHWAHLLVHGLLHLLGHDHENETEAEAMEALETRVLAELGIPNPYEDCPSR